MTRSPEDSDTRSTSRDAPQEPVKEPSPEAQLRRDGAQHEPAAPRVPKGRASSANGWRARLAAFRQRSHEPRGQRPDWKLGPLEYVLLALILLGVAVTIAMAIFNPSA